MSELKGIIEFIWDKFELFVRRAVLPSSVLLGVLLFVDYQTNQAYFTNVYNFLLDKPFILILALSTIFVFSISYFMKFLSQLLFDNLIKTNYDHTFFWNKNENIGFKSLRTQVLQKLVTDKIIPNTDNLQNNDYILYQILGNLLKLDTQRYTTDVKEASIAIISIIIGIIYYISIVKNYWLFILIPILLYIVYIYNKTKYRSRAYRMYVNYLIKQLGENK